MKILRTKQDLTQFWTSLRKAQHALLLLDFDGTLSPFVTDPAQARPYPGVVELLKQLSTTRATRLVIISGRELTSLESCLSLDFPLELWGCHGWQRQRPQGRIAQRTLPPAAKALLTQATQLAQGWELAGQLERKPVSLALHWRGLESARVDTLRSQIERGWRPLTTSGILQLKQFDGGCELCCPQVNKGSAIKQLTAEVGPLIPIAYLGDDLTDEDAFAALATRGLRVLVRPRLRETAADLWLKPPEELLWFLRRWQALTGGRGERD